MNMKKHIDERCLLVVSSLSTVLMALIVKSLNNSKKDS